MPARPVEADGRSLSLERSFDHTPFILSYLRADLRYVNISNACARLSQAGAYVHSPVGTEQEALQIIESEQFDGALQTSWPALFGVAADDAADATKWRCCEGVIWKRQ